MKYPLEMLPSTMHHRQAGEDARDEEQDGMNSVYQSGWIFGFAIRKSAPRPDWCSVESVTPKITAPRVSEAQDAARRFQPSHSATAGENSTNSAIM